MQASGLAKAAPQDPPAGAAPESAPAAPAAPAEPAAPVVPPQPAPSEPTAPAPAPTAPVAPAAEPKIELPAEAEPPPPSAAARPAPLTELARESAIENPLDRNAPAPSGTVIGGYGELALNGASNAPAVIDLRRFVLFFGHNFTDRIRMYSEVEVEHAVSSADDQGEVEIEQAYLDGLISSGFNLRGGVILMPADIVNVYHEPPSFNGVDRPDVDAFVVPTTWREPGVGSFGEIVPGLRYQLYLVNGFDANGFTAESAIAEGHQEAQLARAGNFGAIGRLDYEPVLGTVFGATAYAGKSGDALPHGVGNVPLGLYELDARTRIGGFSARAELAVLTIGDAGALSRALAAGSPEQQAAAPVSSLALGGYAELAYDVLHPLHLTSEHSLTVFGRFDYADTQADVPAGFTAQLEFRRYSGVFGLVWRPIQQIGIKADMRRRELGAGPGYNEYATAITWLF